MKASLAKIGEQDACCWRDADELRWAVRHWVTRVGVSAPHLHIRLMTTKWASISTAGRLTLNAELLSMPKRLGEFVVVHELIHLLAPNHGKVFKSFMHAYLPDWEQREIDLRTASLKIITRNLASRRRQVVTERRQITVQ